MLAIDWPLWLIFIMFLVALLAGWVDTLAGGGGLLTLPALMLAGLPPVSALATNKAQGFVGALTATVVLFLKGHLKIFSLLPLVLSAAIGSMLGTLLIQRVDTSWLHWGIPFLLLGVAGYFFASPQVGKLETASRQSETAYGLTAVPLIAFYDGAIGPGTGSFFAASGVHSARRDPAAGDHPGKTLQLHLQYCLHGSFRRRRTSRLDHCSGDDAWPVLRCHPGQPHHAERR